LWVRFSDGTEGIADLSGQAEVNPIFAPLSDPGFFAQATLNPETRTVQWPNGGDIAPDVLYERATGRKVGLTVDAAAAEFFATGSLTLDPPEGMPSPPGPAAAAG
jgi:hypothetical protein